MALVFLMGGIVLLIGVTIAFFVNSLIDTGYGYKALVQADAAAASGANDAMLQIARNYSTLPNPDSYNLVVGSTTVSVTITQNSPSAGFATVLSTATVANRTRKINVILSINASTSQASMVSWQQIQ